MKIPNINYRRKSLVNPTKIFKDKFASMHKPRKSNSTGFVGVKHANGGRLSAVARHNNIRYWLGTFDTAQEAGDAYQAKLEEMRRPEFMDSEPADHSKFNYKLRKRVNNTSGYTGVIWSSRWRSFRAVIKHKNIGYHLGTFKKAEAANAAYQAALNKFKSEAQIEKGVQLCRISHQ